MNCIAVKTLNILSNKISTFFAQIPHITAEHKANDYISYCTIEYSKSKCDDKVRDDRGMIRWPIVLRMFWRPTNHLITVISTWSHRMNRVPLVKNVIDAILRFDQEYSFPFWFVFDDGWPRVATVQKRVCSKTCIKRKRCYKRNCIHNTSPNLGSLQKSPVSFTDVSSCIWFAFFIVTFEFTCSAVFNPAVLESAYQNQKWTFPLWWI